MSIGDFLESVHLSGSIYVVSDLFSFCPLVFESLFVGHGTSQLSEIFFDLEVFTGCESSKFSLLIFPRDLKKIAYGAIDLPELF